MEFDEIILLKYFPFIPGVWTAAASFSLGLCGVSLKPWGFLAGWGDVPHSSP